MKTEIQIFENPEFGQIRTMEMPDGQVGFVGKDVAEVLGYARPADAIRQHVEEDDKGVFKLPTPGGTQATTVINESGLYALILSSKLPNARRFKHWVTSEVLPTIRKTGGYGRQMDVASMSAQEMMEALRTPESIMLMCKTMADLDVKVQELTPKAEFAEAVMASDDTCTMAELAKLLFDNGVEIGQNRLFVWMRDHHFLGSSEHHRNVPMQRWVEAGLFKVKTSEPWYDDNGRSHYNITPLVTGKGQEYFVRRFLSKTLSPASPF